MIKYSKIKRFLEYLNYIVMFFILYFDEICIKNQQYLNGHGKVYFFRTLADTSGRIRTKREKKTQPKIDRTDLY